MRARALLALAVCLLAAAAQPQPSQAASTAKRMVSIARGELQRGVREIPDGSNRGGRIQMYGRSTTPRFYPAPWCAYFVSWVARRAGRSLGPSGQGFGYVPYLKAWAQRTGRWKRKPRSGDLIMFPQHVGLVEAVYRNGTLTTIEGNSSNRVNRRWRRWSEASGYVRVATGGSVQRTRTKPRPRPKPKRATPLVPRISVYPGATVAAGQTVGFSANDSTGDIASYRWDLDGDGRFDDRRGDNAERRYAKAGDVRVGLEVRDRRGRTRRTRTLVRVRVNRAPDAKLVLARTATLGTKVTGHAEESTDDGRIVRYEWDMEGDGRWVSDDAHRDHTYRRPGVYAVGLRVYDDQGAMSEAITTIEITQQAPVARASSPDAADVGESVTFDGSRSWDRDGDVRSWSWDFDGDGTIDAEGRRVSWRFASPGTWRGRLLVRDEWGAEASAPLTVDVRNGRPTAVLAPPSRVVAGEETVFDASRSWDGDGLVAAHAWDFDGDGAPDAAGPTAAWTFATAGEHRVRLVVADEWGAQSATETRVRVLARPVARLALLTASPVAGGPVSLDARATGDPDGELERLEWDLDGDGRSDHTSRRPSTLTVTYARAGSYTATVTAVDGDGLRASASVAVDVR